MTAFSVSQISYYSAGDKDFQFGIKQYSFSMPAIFPCPILGIWRKQVPGRYLWSLVFRFVFRREENACPDCT